MQTNAARTNAMRRVLLICAALISVVCGPAFAYAGLPNILLCMADDQGWGDTGYNGHPVLQTPNLDAMADAGLRFDRFYAAAPVCTPTRGSVLTGRHPNRYGAFQWGLPMRPQEITIAERLKEVGYATGHFGKWHLGSVLKGSPVNPGAAGFEHWLSAPNFYDNDPILSREGKAVQLQGESSMVAADAAIEFMRNQAASATPFLAVVWFGSPHSPHRARAEDRELYADQKGNVDWLGEISGLDRAVGKLRETLRELKIEHETLFWYTSDNGGLKMDSTGGRAKKGSIYEGGLRVPAIIEWPARIREPRVTQVPAVTSDIFPTLLELVGLEPEDQPALDGVSLVPTIDGKLEQRSRPIGFWNFAAAGVSTPSAVWMAELLEAQQAGKDYHDASRLVLDAADIQTTYARDRYPGHAAWLDWPWKLHQLNARKPTANSKVEIELYHLGEDPMETTDVAAEHPERVEAMRVDLEAWLTSVIESLNGGDYE